MLQPSPHWLLSSKKALPLSGRFLSQVQYNSSATEVKAVYMRLVRKVGASVRRSAS
jgi:hypothetical protein